MAKLKYGNELIKKIAAPIHKIDEQIEALRKEKEKLEKEVAKSEKNFSLRAIKGSRGKKAELEDITNAYERAKKHRQQLLDNNTMDHYNEIAALVNDVIATEKEAKKESVEKIKKNIVEIYELYDDAKAYDEQVAEDIDKLIKAAKPYLSEKDLFAGGLSTAYDRLGLLVGSGRFTDGMKIVDFINLNNYNITGLIPPSNDMYRLKLDE